MTRTLVCLTLATLLTVSGCGGRGAGSTPEATFGVYKSAMSDRNFDDVWDMLSAASQERVQRDATEVNGRAMTAEGPERAYLENAAKLMGLTLEQMKKMDGRQFYVGLLKMVADRGREEWDKLSRAEVSRVEKDGERAKVFIRSDGVEQTARPLPLVLEDGRWKVDLVGVPMGALLRPEFPSTPPTAPEVPRETP